MKTAWMVLLVCFGGFHALAQDSSNLIDALQTAKIVRAADPRVVLTRLQLFPTDPPHLWWPGDGTTTCEIKDGRLCIQTQGSDTVYGPSIRFLRLNDIDSIKIVLTVSGTNAVKLGTFSSDEMAVLSVEPDKETSCTVTKPAMANWQGETDMFRLSVDAVARICIKSIDINVRDQRFNKPTGASLVKVAESERRALYMHCPARIEFPLRVPEHGRFFTGIKVADPAQDVTFGVEVKSGDRTERVFSETTHCDAEWRDVEVDLSAFANQDVTLALDAQAAGANQVAFWSNPAVTAAGPSESEHPNILLYVIDALRADHLDAYGYARRTAPCLTGLAQTGVLFSRCFSQDTCTQPSMTTLHTGVDHFIHKMSEDATEHFSASLISFTELLREAGYYTVAITKNAHTPPRTSRAIYDEIIEPFENVVGDAGKVLDRVKNRKFFLYIHTIETHIQAIPGHGTKMWGYYAPPPFDQLWPLTSDVADIDHYDASIPYADDIFRQVHAELESAGLAAKTLVVVTSDHGEAFLEHEGMTQHGGKPYPELIHIPLIFSQAGAMPSGKVIDQNVQLLDLAPTFLGLAGVPAPPQFQGKNLLSLLKGEDSRAFDERLTVSFGFENGYGMSTIRGKWQVLFDLPFRLQLYDLQTDPAGRNDVLGQHRDVTPAIAVETARHFSSQMAQARSIQLPADKTPLDPRQKEILESLGYLK